MAGEDFAVVIGITHYPQLVDLEGPVKDAQEFARWLTGPAQVPDTNVFPVLSRDPQEPGGRPVQDEIDDAFERVFAAARALSARGKGPNRLYIYFAGHGCAQGFRHVALLVANASLQALNRGLDTESYHNGLGKDALFPEQVFFYDCCRNYDRRVRGRSAPWPDDEPPVGAGRVKQFVLYGAGFNEYANERKLRFDTRRGLFTRALIDGLNGAAAKRVGREWVVTSDSLVTYSQKRLDGLARQENLEQHLEYNPAGLPGALSLATVREPWHQLVTIKTRAPGLNVVIEPTDAQPPRHFDAVEHEITVELSFGQYNVRTEPGGYVDPPMEVIPGVPLDVVV
jgi:hypothetical protein